MKAVLAIASNTVREALSRRAVLLFLFGALVLIVMAPLFSFLTAREEMTMLKSLGLGVIQLASMFICITLGIQLIPTELERRTIYTVLSKPVHRYEFVLGKFLGAVATMAINIIVMGVVFTAVLWFRTHSLPDGLLIWKGLLLMLFQMSILGSMAIFFSVFMTPFVNFFLTLGCYTIGLFSTVTENLMKDANRTIIQRAVGGFVHYVIPNFANFNAQNPIIHPETRITNEVVYYVNNIGYAMLWMIVLLIIATIVFDRKEV